MQDAGRSYSARFKVRIYELDFNGHVNNAVYLNYAEQVATEHAETEGFGRQWSEQLGGTWVVRRTEITYRHPAYFGDELEVTTRIGSVRGARGLRTTTIRRVADGQAIADVLTEWVWVRLADMRATRVPPELVAKLTGSGPRRVLAH